MAMANGSPNSLGLQIKINGWEEREDSSTFVVYQVRLITEAGGWTVSRRYSQFLDLYNKLQERFPGRKWSSFPKKKMTGNLDPDFVNERSRQLGNFLSELTQDPEVLRSVEFRAFIDANLDVQVKNSRLGPSSDARKRTPMLTRKLAVLGFMGVGKSAVTIQFAEGHFPETYSPTIENTFHKIIKHRGTDYATDILDTAGQDEYQIFHTRYAMGIHGYVIVYAVTLRRSFEMAKAIHEKLMNAMGTEVIPKILVGSKRDLIHERQVTTEEGAKLAEEWACPFVECSAKYNENIGDIFNKLIAEIERMSSINHDAPESCSIS